MRAVHASPGRGSPAGEDEGDALRAFGLPPSMPLNSAHGPGEDVPLGGAELGDRQRDLLPLPHLALEFCRSPGKLSRKVHRRVLRRVHVQRETNAAVSALNSLYLGYDPGTICTVSSSSMEELPEHQRETLLHLIRGVKGVGGPPEGARGTGALEALRVASSPYGGELSGVGEVVSMNLEQLSIPNVGSTGVHVEDILEGKAGQFLRDPENWMLQDARNWSWLSDEAAKIKTYDDPRLRNQEFYHDFLVKLHAAGVLKFSSEARGRVGCFTVSKKPKEVNGVMVPRQRLILDCRRVNLAFRAPPVTELGSLPAVSDLYIPDGKTLYIAGGDIKDCFYACRLPEALTSYFAFTWDVPVRDAVEIMGKTTVVSLMAWICLRQLAPASVFFPMGFSWSFYLVQALHVQGCLESLQRDPSLIVLDARPAPDLCKHEAVSMPYCDNTHVLSLEPGVAENGGKELEAKLEQWGFQVHEQMSATSYFPTLGGIIDGEVGIVKATPERHWKLKRAFEYVVHRPVSSKAIERLLGHAMVTLVLNRAGMGIFRALYDFAGRRYTRAYLWPSAKRECKIFIGVLPLLVGNMRSAWSETVTCTDASPDGFGICERTLSLQHVAEVGAWHERWRFKRTPVEEWRPRARALGLYPLRSLNSARGDPDAFEWGDSFSRNEQFLEVPFHIMEPSEFQVVLNGSWKHEHEQITLKEGRTLVLAVRRLVRSSRNRGRKHLILVDNLALALAIGKGRSCNYSMLRVSQKLGALALAAGLSLRVRWIPSEVNVSDGPSRGSKSPGYIKEDRLITNLSELFEAEGVFRREDAPARRSTAARAEEPCQGSSPAGSAGEEGRHDLPGDQQRERGAAVPVWQIPGPFQGVLPGERVELASKAAHGRDPRGLLRRSVPRRESCSRWREDLSCRGVPVSPVSGAAPPQQESFEGLAETETSQVTASTSQGDSLWHGDEDAARWAPRHGVVPSSELRYLPSPRGSFLSLSEESGEAGEGIGATVQPLHIGGSGRGRAGPGQDRDLQQLPALGQPRDGSLAGEESDEDGRQQGPSRAAIQLRPRQVPQGVSVLRTLAWAAGAARLPNQTWRRLRRLGKRASRPQWSQVPWEVADRGVREKICQIWEGSTPPQQASGVGASVLPAVDREDGISSQRLLSSTDGLTWRCAPPGTFLEIFSGSGRLHTALREAGHPAFGIDLAHCKADDVLQPAVEDRILQLLISGHVTMVWLGMPCASFSASRRLDGLGPGPLRDDLHPMEKPWLKGKDRATLLTGNHVFFFSMRIVIACLCLRIAVVFENPASSRCWLTPILHRLVEERLLTCTDLDFCQFGERWRKPTRLAAFGIDLHLLGRKCKGSFLACSYSGKRHIPLTGTDNNGRFMSLIAQPYPFRFCSEVAQLFFEQLGKNTRG